MSLVDEEALRSKLEALVLKGRRTSEAAGEVQWLAEATERAGVTSADSTREAIAVIRGWVAQRSNDDAEMIDLEMGVAAIYARFVHERVTLDDLSRPAWGQIEQAWRDWREERSP